VELTHESRRHISSIFKEAMNNALRHAECRHVALAATVEGESFTVSLTDDGKGYLRSLAHTGSGLKNMELRAKKIDGTIRIASEPGAGSRITLTRRARQTTGP
jgi:signal transduction histidine kinase